MAENTTAIELDAETERIIGEFAAAKWQHGRRSADDESVWPELERTGTALVARIREVEQEARVNGLQQGVYSFANYLCIELQEVPPTRQAIQEAADDYFMSDTGAHQEETK